MIGTLTKPFQLAALRELLHKSTNLDDLKKAKEYILSYFGHCIASIGVIMWCPHKSTFRLLSDPEAKKFIRKDVVSIRIPGSKKPVAIDIQNWFFHDHDILYEVNCDQTKPLVYEEGGANYINLFPGFLYKNENKFSEYNQEKRDAVQLILKHIEKVWCSKNPDQYKYVLNWLAHMISGRKMNSALLLRSKQGTGKSIVTEFIQEKVLGNSLVLTSSDPNTVLGTFNRELLGKSLLVLEEMPASTQAEWRASSERLKHIITGASMQIHEKNKTPFTVPNSISLMILSNNNAIRLDTADRRYFIPDISLEYIGNHEYFDKLSEAMEKDGVGEAFFAYMKEIARQKFKENKIPKTAAKQDQIIESLHSIHIFIKEDYLRAGQGIDEQFSSFYGKYCMRREKPSSKIAISKLLASDLDLKAFQKRIGKDRYQWLNISFRDLYTKYENKSWMHEIDEIESLKDIKDLINTENVKTELQDISEQILKVEEPKLEKADASSSKPRNTDTSSSKPAENENQISIQCNDSLNKKDLSACYREYLISLGLDKLIKSKVQKEPECALSENSEVISLDNWGEELAQYF